MTTRHSGYVVVLEEDMREDDASSIIDAIGLLRGVLSVKPIERGCNLDQHVAEERVRHELGQKLLRVVYPNRFKSERGFG